MDKVKTKIELYLKIYFQIRFYLFLASFHYLIFNNFFTFQINTDNLVFLLMYIFALILMVFSWIYCFLLSRIITKNSSKKIVFYINSILLILSLILFIYWAFITKDNSIESIVLILLPFLSFNIISWLVTKRAVNKNIIVSKNFLRNTFIWWIIFSILFFIIGSLQPYNRIVIPKKITEINLNNYSKGFENLTKFQNKYKENYFFKDYLYCMKSPDNNDCFENEIFWEKLLMKKREYQNSWEIIPSDMKIEDYTNIIYDSIDEKKLDELLAIESDLQEAIRYWFYKTPLEYNKNNSKPITFSKLNVFYQNTINYLIDTKKYSQANMIINNYIKFMNVYNILDPFSYHLNDYIILYYKRLEENNYTSIVYPENIEVYINSMLWNFSRSYIDDYKWELYYWFPDFLFILNKKQLIKHSYYHTSLISKNQYTFTYQPPIIHYPLGSFLVKFQWDFDFKNSAKDNILNIKNYILERK